LFAIHEEKRQLVTEMHRHEVTVINGYYNTGYGEGKLMHLTEDTVEGWVFVSTVMNCRVELKKVVSSARELISV